MSAGPQRCGIETDVDIITLDASEMLSLRDIGFRAEKVLLLCLSLKGQHELYRVGEGPKFEMNLMRIDKQGSLSLGEEGLQRLGVGGRGVLRTSGLNVTGVVRKNSTVARRTFCDVDQSNMKLQRSRR